MKGLNQSELREICKEVQTWVGAQLQDIIANETWIALGFYHEQETQWLLFDFGANPVCLVLEDPIAKRLQKKMKPIVLFMRSHFEGKRLSLIGIVKDKGRVLKLGFHSDVELVVEAVLFSQAKNFTAHAGAKRVSFFKPKDFSAHENQNSETLTRSHQEIKDEWIAEKGLNSKKPVDQRQQLEKMIEKKTSALSKMKNDLELKTKARWADVGESLKTHQHLDIDDELREFVDYEKSLSENIKISFQKAKDQERKVLVARDRIDLLQLEIEKLKREGLKPAEAQPKKSFLQKVDAQARTFKMDEGLQAFIGKSAKDNLDILRRAQPFDLWIHLRDVPSAHVIIRKSKSRQVTDAELRKIASWLVSENFGKKAKERSGEFFDLIICECRFVKPIKGDKLGRVNYQHDRTLRLKYEP